MYTLVFLETGSCRILRNLVVFDFSFPSVFDVSFGGIFLDFLSACYFPSFFTSLFFIDGTMTMQASTTNMASLNVLSDDVSLRTDNPSSDTSNSINDSASSSVVVGNSDISVVVPEKRAKKDNPVEKATADHVELSASAPQHPSQNQEK